MLSKICKLVLNIGVVKELHANRYFLVELVLHMAGHTQKEGL
jgi:hypothetical protein